MARVLVLDDEQLIRRAFGRALRQYEVHEASSCQEARALIEENNFDALVLDVQLGRETSEHLVEWIAAQHPHLVSRIVLLSGATIPPDFFFPKGARFQPKPVGVVDLRALVASLVAG
jgi:DNA-binding NtrC family response regulator